MYLNFNSISCNNHFVQQHQGEIPPKPTRGKIIDVSTEALDVACDHEKLAFEIDIQDILPRVDISPPITDALINELADKNWKVRKYK